MKRKIWVILLGLSGVNAYANIEDQQEVNYGDPTASFSTLGVSASHDVTQLNGMMGMGSNIFSVDLGRQNKNGGMNYRGRYFHVTDGLGFSVDILGDKDNTTALAGAIYKFQLSDNISLFPMLSAGYTRSDTNGEKVGSTLAQVGVYGMYGFDAGHWIYANPKSTYHVKGKESVDQVEMGGGFMLLENVSVGGKIEHTAKGKAHAEDTVTWLQANHYF